MPNRKQFYTGQNKDISEAEFIKQCHKFGWDDGDKPYPKNMNTVYSMIAVKYDMQVDYMANNTHNGYRYEDYNKSLPSSAFNTFVTLEY